MKLFDEYPYLENDRIIMRKLVDSDAEGIAELTSRAAVYKTIPGFLYELKYEDKRDVIANMDRECFEAHESLFLGIFLKNDPEHLIGIAEFYNYEENKSKASIGARIHDDYWDKGIATDVAVMMRDYLTKDVGLSTVTSHVLRVNAGSRRVMEKTGFVNKYPGLYEDWGFGELMLTDKYVYKKEWNDTSIIDKLPDVRVEQFVMAYRAEQDRIRALLPDGYTSLRPVLRINAEIRDDTKLYLEFNTPVEADGRRGWLNIDNWKSTHDNITFERDGDTVRINAPFLSLYFTGTGIEGGCPAEPDNEGCYYLGNDLEFRLAEKIEENKEFCDCGFAWKFHEGDAGGVSEGKTIPAEYTSPQNEYEKCELSAENAAAIPCMQVLGSYKVRFIREQKQQG